MNENIVNIFLIIEDEFVTGFKAKSHNIDGSDQEKIEFLKNNVNLDFQTAEYFRLPLNVTGSRIQYKKFAKLEDRGLHIQLFEEIFRKFETPESPLICVTPVINGKISV